VTRWANLAIAEADADGGGNVVGYLGRCLEGLDRMKRIVAELLSHARARGGGGPRRRVDEIVEEAIGSLREEATAHGVVISAVYRGHEAPVAHATRVYQVCCNLIRNAIDAMATGGGM